MNLIIDIGNTLIKLAVFENNSLISKVNSTQKEFENNFQKITEEYEDISDVIISSVGNFSEKEILFIQKKYQTIILTHQTKIPFINKYKTGYLPRLQSTSSMQI